MKIVFLLVSTSQPRCLKRIEMFLNRGYEVKVYGFTRKYYKKNAKINGVEICSLGEIDDSKYLYRFYRSLIAVCRIIKENGRGKEVIYYSFGFDFSLFLSILNQKFIYEISDIIYLRFHGMVRRFFRKIDLFMINKSSKTIFTSGGFLKFLDLEENDKYLIIPNKVNPKLSSVERNIFSINQKKRIKIGYVGRVRYPKSFLTFMETISLFEDKFEFHIYGDGQLKNEIESFIQRSTVSNIYYYGSFVNPDDIESIYNSIDVSFVCYKATDNEIYLEPNKLYESILFCNPLIGQVDTFLEQSINKYGVGFSIDSTDRNEIVAFLTNLTQEMIKTKSIKCYKIDRQKLLNSEYDVDGVIVKNKYE